jgi:hypothetical protein
MKRVFLLLQIFVFLNSFLFSQSINGRISSSIYSFKRYDTVNVSSTYARAYEMLNLNINQGNYSLRSYINFASDISKDLKNDPQLSFYNLYFEARKVLDIATIKIGRQPLFNSVAGGVYDGINLDVKKGDYKFSGYYGGNVPPYQKLKLISDWNNNYILGGRLTTTSLENFQISLSYINKNFKAQDYYASRLDADLNPITVLIRNNSNEYKFASGEVNYYLKDQLSINTRLDYDLNFEEISKVELFGNYEKISNLKLNLYYNYREPRIRYNSIFSVFDFGNTQEIEAGADYIINKNFTVTGKVGDVIYKDESSQRATVALSTNYGSLSYRKTFGYEGELDAVSVYGAYSFLEGMITPSVGLSYTSYKLSPDDNTNNLTTLLTGVNYRPFNLLSFDLQGQFLNNKIYKDDFRLFFKINYWFNTILGLM